MSFASDVKAEMLRVKPTEACCMHSELNALIKFGGIVLDNKIELKYTSSAVTRRALYLIKKFFPNAQTGVAFSQIKPMNNTRHYTVKVFLTPHTEPLRQTFFCNEFPPDDCCRAAFLRGMFLARGTLNRPESKYHWEIVTLDETLALFTVRMLNQMDFPAKMFVRNQKFIAYMKDFESIADFLAFTGANEAVDRCEAARNVKEVRVLATRLVNCETSNLQLAVDAAQRQIEDIKFIIKKGVPLTPELDKTARARLKHPEMPMSELAEMLFVTTGGLKGRMRRLRALAAQAR